MNQLTVNDAILMLENINKHEIKRAATPFMRDLLRESEASIKGELLFLEFVEDGNFTIANAHLANGKHLFGVSKRNACDKPNKMKGQALALSRALRKELQRRSNEKLEIPF